MEDYLANSLDNTVRNAFLSRFVDNQPFFSKAVQSFRGSCSPMSFKIALNQATFSRGYGTFASVVVSMVFYPHLYTLTAAMTPLERVFQIHLTHAQLHDILATTFKLITEDGLTVDFIDYYEKTPAETVNMAVVTIGDMMSPEVKAAVRPFWRLMKFGPRLVNVQQRYVREWVRQRREKRAVKLIEEWWFHVANSPYTPVGKKVLAKRSAAFLAAYG